MTQQVPSRSKLRKGLLTVGIVLLVLGFFLFGVVSANPILTSKYYANFNISALPSNPQDLIDSGGIHDAEAASFMLMTGDTVSVEVSEQNFTENILDTNTTLPNIHIYLYQEYGNMNENLVESSNSTSVRYTSGMYGYYYFYLDYLNAHPEPLGLDYQVRVGSPNVINETLNVVVSVGHYGFGSNNLLFACTGLFLSLLAAVLIFESRKY